MISRVAEANKITTGDSRSALAALDERSVRLDDVTVYPQIFWISCRSVPYFLPDAGAFLYI